MKKFEKAAELAWVLGIILVSMGVCLCSKSGFGVSMIAAPAYISYLKISSIFSIATYGKVEYCFQGLLILLLIIAFRKFKWKYLLSFLTAILFGIVLDLWFLVFGTEGYVILSQRIISCVAGILITALGVAFFLRTYLPLQAYELVVKEIVDKYQFPMTKVKWIYDISSLVVAILLMFIFFGRFDFSMVGINTLVCTFVNAPLIGLFGKIIDQIFDYKPISAKFGDWFNRIMN